MGKRILEVNKKEAKELKKKLRYVKNSVEVKRIMIMVNYLNWYNTKEVGKNLSVSEWTVCNTLKAYKEDKDNFYKTRFTGRRPSKKSNEIKGKIEKIIEDKINKWEMIDLKDIEEEYNRKEKDKVTYKQIWWYVRKRLWYNYQKPYVRDKRKSEYAEKIVKWRLTREIIKIWIEENKIDAESIKNKKTKFWQNS